MHVVRPTDGMTSGLLRGLVVGLLTSGRSDATTLHIFFFAYVGRYY